MKDMNYIIKMTGIYSCSRMTNVLKCITAIIKLSQ